MREKESYITLFVIVLGSISLYLFSVLDISIARICPKSTCSKIQPLQDIRSFNINRLWNNYRI